MTRKKRLLLVGLLSATLTGVGLLSASAASRVLFYGALGTVAPEPLRIWAGHKLINEGPIGTRALVLAFDDRSELVRSQLGATLALTPEGCRALGRIAVKGSSRARLSALRSMEGATHAEVSVPVLRAALGAEEAELRIATLAVLRQLRGKATPAWQEVAASLKQSTGEEARLAAVILKEIALNSRFKKLPDSTSAGLLEVLEPALTSSDPELRWCAAQGMEGLSLKDDRMALPLAEGLSSNVPSRVQQAAMSLSSLGKKAAAAVGPMTAALETSMENAARFFLLRSLGNVGPAAARAIPVLTREALKSEHKNHRGGAVVSLGKIAPERLDVVMTLIAASKDPESHVRGLAAVMLGECEDHRRQVIPRLRECLKDPVEAVRSQAKRGLVALGAE